MEPLCRDTRYEDFSLSTSHAGFRDMTRYAFDGTIADEATRV